MDLPWCNIPKGLKNQGAVMTGSAYPGLWSLVYTPGDLESMAEAYTNVYINTCGPNRYRRILQMLLRTPRVIGYRSPSEQKL